MPAFCQRCGELADGDACAKCGEKTVAGATAKWAGVGAVPSAFTAAARIQSMGVTPVVTERPRKEKATALFNFIPQDSATQLKLTKGDEIEVVRKDPDGWWFVVKDGEKGLVPGSYVRIDKPFVAVPDAAILAAREASNQRFMELSRPSEANGADGTLNVEYSSPMGLDAHGDLPPAPVLPPARNSPARADVRAGDGTGEKPQNVRKLRKCFACKETILGRTKTAKDQIFHEICLLCKGCREPIGEDEDYILIKKKAYHADCGKDVAHCWVCDKEILGRVYKAGDGSFHRLCMICSVCKKQADEAGSKLDNDELVCGSCIKERERKAREEREAKERAAREKAEREAAEAAARALAEKKAREAEEAARAKMEAEARAKAEAEAAARAKAEAEAAAARAKEEQAAREKAEAEAAAAAAKANASGYDSQRSSTAGLDEFDLEATPIGLTGHERMSEVSDFGSVLDSDYGYSNSNTGRDSMRLSEVLDMESINAFNNGQNNRLSDISGLSIDSTQPKGRPRRSTLQEDREEYLSDDEEDRELCGGCGLVLEGEAVGALNQYFHYQCFKCSHCRRVIAEDDGYAEKDNMAFHQACYQARFGKKCCRCSQVLKGKVVKALDNLYHPDCFVCFKCSSSLSESFFEHEGQAVCAKCKHEAIAYAQPPVPAVITPIGVGVAGYRFDAQDETQLTIYPGDKVSILQKDDDGWWLVDFNKKRGYVPGSYLIEEPPARPKAAAAPVPGLCSECGTQNPGVARFCRSCGNNLQP